MHRLRAESAPGHAGRRASERARAAESLLEHKQFALCRPRGPVATLPGMSKHRQWPGPKGQSYVAAPELPAYDRPPASDVTIVRPDGTQETRPALAPRLSRGSYDPARTKPLETAKSAKKCASCDGEFKEGQQKQRQYDAWRHLPGECAPNAIPPVQPRPTGRKVPLHEKVARRFWIRRRCPVCDAKAGQDCTDAGEPGAKRYSGSTGTMSGSRRSSRSARRPRRPRRRNARKTSTRAGAPRAWFPRTS